MDINEARNSYLESKKESDKIIDQINDLVMINGLIENKNKSLFKDINLIIIVLISMVGSFAFGLFTIGKIISLIPAFSLVVSSFVLKDLIRDFKNIANGNIFKFIKENNKMININRNKIIELEKVYNYKNNITHEYLSVLEDLETSLLVDNDLLIKEDYKEKNKVLVK